MFTDIAGYTSLAQRNEALALELLEEHRRLIRPFFRKHRGKEIKTIGDAFLVEFASALEALRCAYEIQQSLHERNNPNVRNRIDIKIGIHLGDIVHDDKRDVYGDAVNVASRIEPLAEPGGICISEQVYVHVRNKFEFPLASLGRRDLKNVELPIEVFKVVLPWLMIMGREGNLNKRRIAVLPFSSISPDPNDEYFADGMTEELISTMSKISGLKVIARTSVMGYKGAGLRKINEVARELEVGTILEGSVRKAGDRLRITVQLIDCASSDHIWSESYNREMKDVFAIQSDISETVAEALKVKLLTQEKQRIETESTSNMESYSAYLKGRTLLHSRTRKPLLDAREQFELAINLDPSFAQAYAGLADALSLLFLSGFDNNRGTPDRAKALATKAIELNPDLAEAHCSLGGILDTTGRKFKQAERELRTAIALNPSYALAHHWYAIYLQEEGRLEEAMKEEILAEEADPLTVPVLGNIATLLMYFGRMDEAFERIEKLSKIDLRAHYFSLIYYYFVKGDYQRALEYLEKALQLSDPQLRAISDYGNHGVYYALIGQKDKAFECIKQLEQLPDELFPPNQKQLWIAEIYALSGDMDSCFERLERAPHDYPTAIMLRGFPLFKKVREDPRFDPLITRIRAED